MNQQNTSEYARFAEQIHDGAKRLNFELDSGKITNFTAYLEQFIKWNKAYNLSAIRDPEQIISKHLLDSLSIASLIEGNRFIDVGTGGGLPGIPLAIAFPERSFTLLDSNGKKTRFLFQVKQLLELDNVEIVDHRVESYHPEPRFDGVITRAFSSLKTMTESCDHLLNDDGRFWAMKGVFPEDELRQLEKRYIVEATFKLDVPEVGGERTLVVLRKSLSKSLR